MPSDASPPPAAIAHSGCNDHTLTAGNHTNHAEMPAARNPASGPFRYGLTNGRDVTRPPAADHAMQAST